MKRSNTNDYSYLTDLNDADSTYYFAGREYLRDLPVRPTKRKRGSASTTTATPASKNVASWFRDVRHASSVNWKGCRVNLTFSTLVSLIIVTLVVCLRRVRKSEAKYQTTPPDATTTLKADEDASRKKERKKKNRETPAKSKAGVKSQLIQMNEGIADSKDTIEVIDEPLAIETRIVPSCNREQFDSVDERENKGGVTKQSESIYVIQGENSQFNQAESSLKEGVLVITCDNTIDGQTMTTAISTNEPISASLCMANYPMEKIASRWESKGLDRQKSLELAANFEMNMFFFEQMKLSLSGASFHFLNQMNLFSTKIQDQIEMNHTDIMEVPKMEKLQQYREQISYSLVNVKMMTRCLFLALAGRLYPFVMDWPTLVLSPVNALSTIITNLCPECIAPNTEQSAIAGASYLASYFAIEYCRNLVYQMSHAWVFVGRLIWCVSCLGVCHRFISRSLSYAILAIVFIPWKDFLLTSGAVLAANISLTLWMLKKCKNFELTAGRISPTSERSKTTEQIIKYYAWIIPRYQTAVYVSSAVIGFYMALRV